MSTPAEATPTPSGARRFFGWLARAILLLALGIALGVALYLGLPALYRQFIQPVQQHTMQINSLATRQAQTEADSSARLEALLGRIETLERQNDLARQALDGAQTGLEAQRAALEIQSSHVSYLATVQADQGVNSQRLNSAIATLQASTASRGAELDALLAQLEDQVQALELGQASSVTQSELNRELLTLRLIDVLNRARSSLAENNVGLAEQDLGSALALAKALNAVLPATDAAFGAQLTLHLENALAELPERPVAADNQLESAWDLLIDGQAPATATPTLVP